MARKYRSKDGNDNPGPTSYSNPNLHLYKKFANKGVKFGNSGRGKDKDGNDVPGPGSFNIRSKFKGGYSFGRSKRSNINKDNDTPGVGAYTLGSFKVISQNFQFF